jgi:uncharacterized protein YjhX (UPF0386 family)
MRITIAYEASWRNSFLDGDNNEGDTWRKYVGSMQSLKKDGYKKREVTIDTVMGVLNRLIGDQRKLYQSRSAENYFFKDLESRISFTDEKKVISDEVVYLRNLNKSTNPAGFSGALLIDDLVFISDYSCYLWSILWMDIDDLIVFLGDSQCRLDEKWHKSDVGPFEIISRFDEVSKLKLEMTPQAEVLIEKYTKCFGNEVSAYLNKGKPIVLALYASALYLQMQRLEEGGFDLTSLKTAQGKIPGISLRGITPKDFLKRFSSGGSKLVYGNPYIHTTRTKGVGEEQHLLQKVSGLLLIDIDVETSSALKLKQIINDAGVSAFYLGKKGLAYVKNITI